MLCVGLLGLVMWCEEPRQPVAADTFCVVARPIRPSRKDRLTELTKRQLLAHNLKWRRLCGTGKTKSYNFHVRRAPLK